MMNRTETRRIMEECANAMSRMEKEGASASWALGYLLTGIAFIYEDGQGNRETSEAIMDDVLAKYRESMK